MGAECKKWRAAHKGHNCVGTRSKVMNKNALKTTGGLKKSDLKMSHGRIVSVKKSQQAKARYNANPKIRKALARGRKKLGTQKK